MDEKRLYVLCGLSRLTVAVADGLARDAAGPLEGRLPHGLEAGNEAVVAGPEAAVRRIADAVRPLR